MYNSKTTARPYQEKALKRALKKGKYALFMDPGTGKTKVAVDFAGIKYLEGSVKKILVLAPVLAMGVWADEFEKHLDSNIPYHITYVEGTNKGDRINKALNHTEGLNVLIASYDSAVNWQVELEDFKGDLIICDESHYLKSHTTVRNKTAYDLAKDYEYRLILTGTPLPKNALDIFGQFLVLNDSILGDNWFAFKNKYAVYGGFQKRQIIKWKNLETLKVLIRENSIRITNDVLGLPPINEQVIPVKLQPHTRAIYNEFAKEMIAEYGENTFVASIPIVKIMKLKQLASGFSVNDEDNIVPISSEKADACEELMGGLIDAGEKIVVFAHYKYELMEIAKRVKKLGHTPLIIFGGVSRENRDKMRKLFQEDSSYPVIICQLSAGGLGIDLFSARYSIFYSLDRQSDHLTQCIGRTYRNGQTRPVFFYYLVSEGTIDKVVYDSNKAKIDLAEYMISQKFTLKGVSTK